MDRYINLTEEEIKLGFVSSCVEFVALKLKTSFQDAYQRLKRADMLKNYIYQCYDALHSDSRENVTDELVNLLIRRETKLV